MIGKRFSSDDEVLARLRRLEHRVNSIQLGTGTTNVTNITETGVENFVELMDVPQTYVGATGELPSVNAAEDGLAFNPYVTVSPTLPILTVRNLTDAEVDPVLQFAVGATPVVKYTMGVDDSDGDDAFRIDKGDALGADLVLYSGGTNAIFGEEACLNVTMADIGNNVILGYRACRYTGFTPFTGDGNVIVGADAAIYIEGNDYDNVILGHEAIQYICDFSYGNVIAGAYTGAAANGGLTRSILLGYYANCGSDIDNVIVIGANATAGAISNECIIGRRWDDTDPAPVTIRSGSPGGADYKLDLWHAGTAKSITSLIRIVNPITDADMDGTGVGLLFGLRAYDAGGGDQYYDAAHIVAVAETDWLEGTITTIDSYLGFYTSLNGVLAEKIRINSAGQLISNLAIGTAPFAPTSTTVCTNLNAGLVDGYHHDQSLLTTAAPTFVALNLSATSNQIVLQSAGITGTITATPASSNKIWTLQNVTGTIYQTGGTDVAVADGGTGASTFALNGILFGNAANAIGVTAIGAEGQILRVGASPFVPAWTTATFPATTTINQLLYSGTANIVSGLSTAASGLLVTSAGGVPSIATDIPTAVKIGGKYVYRADGTDVPVADGGTGLSVGTSGGILGYTAAGTLASSAALTDSVLVVGGGAGATPTSLVSGLGAITQYLRGNAGGEATWATLNQAAVTGLTTTDGPTFDHVHLGANQVYTTTRARAYLSADQLNVTHGVWTKIHLDAESYDSGNNFDSVTNHRFTAPVSGYYMVVGSVCWTNFEANRSYASAIYMNGNQYTTTLTYGSNSVGVIISVTCDVMYLGANQYIELWSLADTTIDTVDIYGNAGFTFLSVHLLSIA